MEKIWQDMYQAALNVLNPREVSSKIEAGGVAAAVESESGKIYVGVCVDTACTLGICAERSAITPRPVAAYSVSAPRSGTPSPARNTASDCRPSIAPLRSPAPCKNASRTLVRLSQFIYPIRSSTR